MKGTMEKGTREKRTKGRESRERTRERHTRVVASWVLQSAKFQGGGRESNRNEEGEELKWEKKERRRKGVGQRQMEGGR
jgi:hypothetical protein